MYSDHEVECMYLGKPFKEKAAPGEDLHEEKMPLHSADESRRIPVSPLILLLEAVAWRAIEPSAAVS